MTFRSKATTSTTLSSADTVAFPSATTLRPGPVLAPVACPPSGAGEPVPLFPDPGDQFPRLRLPDPKRGLNLQPVPCLAPAEARSYVLPVGFLEDPGDHRE